MNHAIDVYRPTGLGAALIHSVPAAPGGSDDRIDMRGVWTIFRRRLGLFLTVVALVLLAGLALTLRQTPVYTVTAQVALNAQIDQIAPVSATEAQREGIAPSSPYTDTQAQIIGSQAMALRVATALDLAGNARFNVVPGDTRRWLGLRAARESVKLSEADARMRAATYLQRRIRVQRVGETFALLIALTDADPGFATAVVNEYARQFTTADVESKKGLNRQSAQFLSSRLEQLRAQAQADTEQVQRYRITHNLPSTSGANLTEQEISTYNQAVASARAQTAEDQARLNTARQQLSRGSSGDDVGEALQSSVVAGLRQRQAELSGQLANLKARYSPLHPEVVRASSELGAVDGQIEAEIKRVISNLEARQRVSAQREGSLQGSLSRASGALSQNNRALAGLDDLQRRAQASQSLYDTYLNRYKEVSAREGTEQPNARILTLATVPTVPSAPNLLLNIVLSLAIGLGLGVAAAFVTELMFAGLTTGDDVESRLHVPYVGFVPALSSVAKGKGTPIASVLDEPRSAFAEAFRSLRATLHYASGGAPQVVAIASSLPEEGKTTTAICLARSLQTAGRRTVLVDCDLRRRGVSAFLRVEAGRPGLIEVLRGAATLDEALIVEGTGLNVLRIAGNSVDEGELLTGERFDALLDELRRRFDSAILDTAPLLPIADARVIAGKADAALLLVRWRKTPDSAVRAALRLLPRDDVNLLGVALTLVDMKKQARFGYGDSGYYHDRYKSYYA